MAPRPSQVRLRAYKVGFGDCLLLTVRYAPAFPDGSSERHMLIDCGTKEASDGGPSLADIAGKVAEHCGGRLDAVVATHRHQDHIRAFGESKPRGILDELQPRVVIRPWTDVPAARTADDVFGLDEKSQQFVAALEGMHRQAKVVEQLAFDNDAIKARAKELAELGMKNTKAIALLEDWAEQNRGVYVKAGDVVALAREFPEVTVQVLGPPTLDQVDRLTSYAKESEEYWLSLAAAGTLGELLTPATPAAQSKALKTVAAPAGVGAAEWLLRTLNSERVTQGLDIVEGFDDVLNNTSVILFVTVGKRTLLLTGDAQAENWSLSLDQALGVNGRPKNAKLRRQLAEVDVYKVGHHGSRNATPQRLYDLWESRTRPLVSVLTTKSHVFEKSVEGAVPKESLVDGLGLVGTVHSTDELPADVWWMDVEASAKGDAAFVFSQGPSMP
jgi:hypothetical protein